MNKENLTPDYLRSLKPDPFAEFFKANAELFVSKAKNGYNYVTFDNLHLDVIHTLRSKGFKVESVVEVDFKGETYISHWKITW